MQGYKRGIRGQRILSHYNQMMITTAMCVWSATIPAMAQCPIGGFDLTEFGRGDWWAGHTVADFNEDGHPDWLYARASTNVSFITLYAGQPGMTPDFDNPLMFIYVPWAADQVHAADFNHDGHMDYVSSHHIPSQQNQVIARLHHGNGDGTFLEPVEVVMFESQRISGSVPIGTIPNEWYLRVADCNGDNELDLVFVSRSETPELKVYVQQTDKTFLQTFQDTLPHQAWSNTYLHDVNHDTLPDLIIVTWDNNGIDIHLNNGDGTFADPTFLPLLDPETRVLTVAFGDLNGDGRDDLLPMSFSSPTWQVFTQDPNGDYQLWQQGITNPDRVPPVNAICDLNGDGLNDMLLNGRHWLLNQGDGTFRNTITVPYYDALEQPIVTDLTSDGVPDLVVVSRERPTAFVITQCDDDCNGNGYSNAEEIFFCDGDPNCGDCDQNGVPDGCDLAFDSEADCSANGVHDACERVCRGDWNDDGLVQIDENLKAIELLTGPGVTVSGSCSAHQIAIYDTDQDHDLDLRDFRANMLWVGYVCPW